MKKKLFLTFTLIVTILGITFAQNRTLTGTVTSAEDGMPMPGVNVTVQGYAGLGTITNVEGKYTLDVPAEATTLDFSFVGMEPQSVTIGGQRIIDVAMQSSSEELEEVTVTALGIKRQTKALGYSAQELQQDELSGARELSISNFLTGKVSGLQVSKTSSGIGGSTNVTIRGNSSLTQNNQPLYVVDGVAISNDSHSSGGLWGDLDYGDGIGDLNPNDIESVSVLKGPNATALYGSRGSNGVIMITTKTGSRRSGIGVEINSNFSVDVINQVPTFQNKYSTGYEETNIYPDYTLEVPPGSGHFYENLPTWHGDSWGPPLDGRRTVINPFVMPGDTTISLLKLLPQDPNNVRDFYDLGMSNQNTIAITGGNENSTARLSIGNTWAHGIMPNHKISNQNIALRTTTKVSDFLSFDAKVNYIHDEGHQRPVLGSTTSENVVYDLAIMGRYVPLDFLKQYYDQTGERGRWPGISNNPYYVVDALKNDDKKDRLLGYASANLKIASWLDLVGQVGADIYTQTLERKWPIGANGADNSKGRLTQNVRRSNVINANAIMTAHKAVSSSLNLSGSLGSEIVSRKWQSSSIDGRVFKAPDVYFISNAQDIRADAGIADKEVQSVFFTGQVAYKEYLFLDVTGRNDWSSALGIHDQSFFYPSVSTSFIFSEAFSSLPKNILSFGKIRASWAQVGNDSDPYLTQNGYNLYSTGWNGLSYASKNSQIPLFNLKNELTTSWEVGADLRFLQNRLAFDVTYYDGYTTNQILPTTISNASGYSSVVINAGKVANKGLELTFNAAPVATSSGFRWDISFNYARNHSEVIELSPGVETYTLIGDSYPNHIEARPGHPYGDIVGYAYKRAPASAGEYAGEYIVNDGGGYVRESTQSVLGNITPDWIGGLNNTISFKGFSLNVLLDFVQGGELSSSTKYQMTAKGTGIWTTWGRRPQDTDEAGNQLPLVGVLPGVNEIVDAEGNVTGYKTNDVAADGQTLWANRAWSEIGEEMVLDGSYISLREVVLSYNFNPSVLKKTPFAGLTISLIGRNLAYLEQHMQGMGISPESAPNTSGAATGIEALSLPSTRTYGVNLRVNF